MSGRSVAKVPQYSSLVQSDMIGLVAFYLVLWIISARVMDVAFVIYVLGVDPHDTAANPPSLGIPGYVIADPKRFCHDTLKYRAEVWSVVRNCGSPATAAAPVHKPKTTLCGHLWR